MSRFEWYQGMREAIRANVASVVHEVAGDIVADVEERQVVPHAVAARKKGHEAGRLASSVRVDEGALDASRIVWDAPFAAKAYFHPEWRFRQEVHGQAKGRWAEDYMAGGSRAGFAPERLRARLTQRGGPL